ncbi:MAG: TetR family transcriptional regulator [Naasia sp.]|uniref:TetR/AcrR family transcriptional regulator n=1 Tax=Naasia sp. TaxID=2546198 RepID=UPI00260E9C64|nr:TetR/AcrR family transcriptional regulator [Naasia sp.]MCU1569427.1 TetR family transcriptional regulator [Naasia sp.]
MPRAGLSPAIVVEAAATLADEVGADRLTLAALAQRLGVALPSLYKHVDGLPDLRRRLAIAATEDLGRGLTDAVAGFAGRDALEALAAGYRDYARRHPGGYALAQVAPAAGDLAHTAAGERATSAVFAALRGYGLEGDALIDATRALRAALHGFVLLEGTGGFGLERSPDRSYQSLVAAFDLAFAAWPAR